MTTITRYLDHDIESNSVQRVDCRLRPGRCLAWIISVSHNAVRDTNGKLDLRAAILRASKADRHPFKHVDEVIVTILYLNARRVQVFRRHDIEGTLDLASIGEKEERCICVGNVKRGRRGREVIRAEHKRRLAVRRLRFSHMEPLRR